MNDWQIDEIGHHIINCGTYRLPINRLHGSFRSWELKSIMQVRRRKWRAEWEIRETIAGHYV